MAVTSLRPAERILGVYAAVVVLVAWQRWTLYPVAGWAALGHGLVLILVGLLSAGRPVECAPRSASRPPLTRGWLRAAAPIVVLLALYGSLDLVNGLGAVPTHDSRVRAWEVSLFGAEVSRLWWAAVPSRGLSTAFHVAYLSFYVLVPGPLLVFLFQGRRAEVDRTTTAIMTAFLACYLCFIFFPVAGPYYEYPRPAPWFLDNFAARASYGVLSGGSSYGAAFPSSHVAATWAAAGGAWMGNRRLGLALGLGATALTIGVVYCQMHYAVDAIAGMAVAAGALVVARALHRPGRFASIPAPALPR